MLTERQFLPLKNGQKVFPKSTFENSQKVIRNATQGQKPTFYPESPNFDIFVNFVKNEIS